MTITLPMLRILLCALLNLTTMPSPALPCPAQATIIAAIAGVLIIAANCILLGQASYAYILAPSTSLPTGWRVPLFLFAIAGIVFYLLTLLLLAVRKDQQVTYTPATEDGAVAVAGFMGSPIREGTAGSESPSKGGERRAGGIKMMCMAADLLDEDHVDSATLAAKSPKGAK